MTKDLSVPPDADQVSGFGTDGGFRYRGVFQAKDRHSFEGRNPEYNASINLDACLRGHDRENSSTPQLIKKSK